MSSKLRVGIVGAGGIARTLHIPGWQRIPDVEIAAVSDINPKAAELVGQQFNVPNVFTDFRKLVAMKDLDVVVVCTPNKAHTPVVLGALAYKKHVICEKPLATTPREVEQMMSAADKARRLLSVVQNHRYRGISQAVKGWITAGNLGQVYYARAWALRRNLLPVAHGFISKKLSGGGVCMDMGVHCLDMAMWLMDFPEPQSVTGLAGAFLAGTDIMPGAWGEWDRQVFNVEDFACGMIRFKNDAVLTLETSWLAHLPEREVINCMLLGTLAGISWPGGIISTTSGRALLDASLQPLPALESGHWTQIQEFYSAVTTGTPVPVPADQSLKTIKILDGIYRSQKTRKEVRV